MQTPSKKFKPSMNWSNIGPAFQTPKTRVLEDDLPDDSPKPLLHILNKQNQLTTKKQKNSTPHSLSSIHRFGPKRLIHSSLIKPRLSSSFHLTDSDKKAHVISFNRTDDDDDSRLNLSQLYDENRKELYFIQCFEIEDRIGSGSFADVFKVRSKDDNNYYAIKVSREKFRGNKDRERKLREVAKYEQLPPHPHLLRFYKAWEERQRLFIQTELCLMSLSAYAELNHDIDELTIRKYLIDLLKAVRHLHQNDLIHLDIKPENIFISQNGACKLGDFGLIYDLKNDTNEEATDGDPKYLAAEVIQGTFTKSADIFSLGMTILELATDLDLPNGGSCWHDLRENRIPEQHLERMSLQLREIIKSMLNKDHTKRPTAQELLEHPLISSMEKEREDELAHGNFKLPEVPQPTQIGTSSNESPITPTVHGGFALSSKPDSASNLLESSPQSFVKNNISVYLDIYTDSSDDSFQQRSREQNEWPSRQRDNSFSDCSEESFHLCEGPVARIDALKTIPTRLNFDSDEDNLMSSESDKNILEEEVKIDCLTSDGHDYPEPNEYDDDDVEDDNAVRLEENDNEEFEDESKFVPPSASTCDRVNKSFNYYLRSSKKVNGRSLAKVFYDLEDEL